MSAHLALRETWAEWAARLFEFEFCAECGGDVADHVPAVTPFGAWFALCAQGGAR